MDIADAVTDAYVSLSPSTPVSKVRGAFETEPDARVVVVAGEDGFEGVIAQADLLSSHHEPDQKARSVARDPPE